MKAPAFEYLKPASLEDCLAALAAYGDDAEILAGGQSLMPMLNFRVAEPRVLIDIGGLSALTALQREEGQLVIGALCTHADIAGSTLVRELVPLLSDAAPHVAHAAIRSRGTIGGSIALADPAAEWPACCLALAAEIELRSQSGDRRVPADGFFHGLYSTDRQADELITAIRVPLADAPKAYLFDEVSRRRGDFAIAGIALTHRAADARLDDLRIVLFGVGDRPFLATQVMAVLEGAPLEEAPIKDAVRRLSDTLNPPDDPAYPGSYRRHVACAVLERALNRLAGGAGHDD